MNLIETLFRNFHDAILILNAVYVSRKKEQKDCGIKSDENVAVFFLMKKEIKLIHSSILISTAPTNNFSHMK